MKMSNTLYAIRDKKTEKFLHKIIQANGEYSTGGWEYYSLLPYPEVFTVVPVLHNLEKRIKDWFHKDNLPELEIVKITYTIEEL